MNTLTYCTIRRDLFDEPLEERFLSALPAIGDHMMVDDDCGDRQKVYRVQHRIWTPALNKELPIEIRWHVAHVTILVIPVEGDPWTDTSEKAMQLIRAGLDVHDSGGATKEELVKYMNDAVDIQDGEADWPGVPKAEEPAFCPKCMEREANNGDG
jgi:hypothetical protein